MKNHENEALQFRADIFKALGHPVRLLIVDLLTKGALSVAEITSETNESLSTTSQHLAMLRQYGIINDERRGRQIYYSIATPYVLDLCTALSNETVAHITARSKYRRKDKFPNSLLSTILILSCSLSALLFSLAPYVIRRPSPFLPTPPPPPPSQRFAHPTMVHRIKCIHCSETNHCKEPDKAETPNELDEIPEITLCAK